MSSTYAELINRGMIRNGKHLPKHDHDYPNKEFGDMSKTDHDWSSSS